MITAANRTFTVVIPARYAASRLPGKPLIEIGGRPLIEHVYRCAAASGAERVIVATDDERIRTACARFGAEAWLTDQAHTSGTERIAEVVARLGLDEQAIVVNLQGDEPLLPAELPAQVAATLAAAPHSAMATLAVKIERAAELYDPAVVKVVCDAQGRALYFSRAPIPWERAQMPQLDDAAVAAGTWWRHLGLYAYRAGFLRRFAELAPAPLERCESLEQLRALWHGFAIEVAYSSQRPGPGVDTPEDVAAVAALLQAELPPAR
ncbi:3-deoxy-manno-octulosonate cytidylyltransferase [Halorhodospira abdelmalekii]|uniref:3-deoxy-manno-octulosonate cytidylyltransferase n=1 Tax=Halorhodospira abdelmalekii TaxID=421629 RepID=UPI001905C0D5|nr:3-deoxy-manno-octulosonate cytidylyltransferase [Halorhodospira abdelmalekii]MBK1734618.1 3-deoxy-manno-octulosonate cytidylyltransferase [Halorhodospira abdelmalekii]